jgi:hypothetical protein
MALVFLLHVALACACSSKNGFYRSSKKWFFLGYKARGPTASPVLRAMDTPTALPHLDFIPGLSDEHLTGMSLCCDRQVGFNEAEVVLVHKECFVGLRRMLRDLATSSFAARQDAAKVQQDLDSALVDFNVKKADSSRLLEILIEDRGEREDFLMSEIRGMRKKVHKQADSLRSAMLRENSLMESLSRFRLESEHCREKLYLLQRVGAGGLPDDAEKQLALASENGSLKLQLEEQRRRVKGLLAERCRFKSEADVHRKRYAEKFDSIVAKNHQDDKALCAMNAEARAMEEELKTARTGLWQLRNMESMLEAERREKEELLCEIEFLKAEKSAFFKIALDMYQAFSYKDAVGVQKAMAHFKENSDVVISVGGV